MDDVRLYTTAVVPSAEAVRVTGVSLKYPILTMAVGETSDLTAKVEPQLATNQHVTWTSSHPEVATVTPNGSLTAAVEAKSEGTATISVTTEDGSFTAASTIHVGPAADDGKAYLMSYFRSDVAQTGQRDQDLHFSYSRDGVKWYELNNNKPVFNLTDELRDPFLAKGEDGIWRLLYTSPVLNSDGSNGPSNEIGYAESSDLVHWTNTKHLDVMKAFKDQGIFVYNSWAPEWSYDPVNEEYVIYWSSTLVNHAPDDNKHYYFTTKDWATFSDAKLLFNPGHKTIDADLYSLDADYQINGQSVRERLAIPADQQIPGNLVWFMFYKDETPANEGGMRTRQTWSAKGITDTASYQDPTHVSDYVTPSKTEGPTVFKVGNKWNLIYDYWWAGKFGLETSVDVSDPASWSNENMDLRIPYRARHSGMTTLGNSEIWNLINHYSLEASYSFNGNAADSSGHGYVGEMIGHPSMMSLQEGNFGYASFNGTEDAIKLNHLQNSFYIRSVSMWVKANETDRAQMLYEEGNQANGGLALKIEGNNLIAGAAKEGRVQTVSTAFQDTSWHHVAAIYEEGILKLYVDGVEKGELNTGFQPKQSDLNQNGEDPQSRNPELYDIETGSNTALVGAGSEQDVFGADSTDAYFGGSLGQVQLFTIPLFSRDVRDLYQAAQDIYDFEPGSPRLEGPALTSRGESFVMNYDLTGMDQNIYAQDLTFTYDPSQLEYESSESVNSDEVVVVDQDQKPGQVRLAVATIGPNARLEGNVLKLHWKVKPDTLAAASTITLSKAVIADEAGHEQELANQTYTIQISITDKTALLTLITNAQSAHDAAAEGTGAGQYPLGSKARLQAAIDQAQAAAGNSSATQQQIDQAVHELAAVLQAFKDSVIRTEPGDTNGDGRFTIGDLAILVGAYGINSEDPNWSSYQDRDLNHDGRIGIEDLAAVARMILN
ncbi:Ig-like domain-containing protein [Paenibacillus hexagrammi]|uniref:Ig-like domain-containing protein n=1 Tax=Paenibacillus hexagrammi TaxID=2908839 RepID=A0ABY3SNK6_9BACL|nr:Ig-like domain-containing protein [Paenibacillus sp. YPD9-1]UJF34824.1 Ig-like domain-containing protein [Paenibacillus sp. YPD9-1]